MDKATVHMHLFKVSNTTEGGRSLESVIDTINGDKLPQRIRRVGSTDVRLDIIKKLPASGQTPAIWLLDFTRFRDTHGPGKTKRNGLVEGLDIGADEYFGEEAAALFVPKHGYLIAQYNHFGVRPRAMEKYFSEYIESEINVFNFRITLDSEAEQRFKRQKFLKKFEVGVDVEMFSKADYQAGNALGDISKVASDLNATRMKLSISVGHDRSRNLVRAIPLLKKFLAGNSAVVSAEVSGRETADGEIEVVDLITEKLVHWEQIEPGADRRLPVEDRFKALRRTYAKWSARINSNFG